MDAATRAEIVIAATPAQVMAVIADLESYPNWSHGVAQADVLHRQDDGRPTSARIRMAVGTLSEDFVLQYTWDGDEAVEWRTDRGLVISALQGRYTCTDNGDGTTTVGYALELQLVMPMLGALRQRGERHILRSALRGLRRQVLASTQAQR